MKPVRLLSCLLLLCFIAGCSKEKDESTGIWFDLNGEKVICQYSQSASWLDQKKGILLQGAFSQQFGRINITIQADSPVSTSTYIYNPSLATPNVKFEYFPSSAGSSFHRSDFMSDTPFSVSITSVSNSLVEGTFQGKVRMDAVVNTITNGRFSLLLNN